MVEPHGIAYGVYIIKCLCEHTQLKGSFRQERISHMNLQMCGLADSKLRVMAKRAAALQATLATATFFLLRMHHCV